MDRLLDYRVVGELDERAVADERGVERGERRLLERRDAPKMTLDQRIAGLDRAGQTCHPHAAADFFERRQSLVKNAVDEDESVPFGLSEAKTLQIGRAEP